ncbi:MAG: hypothetical protein JWN43_3433, partial [Gammaproteobacteria bacterium]|nr:hypothetical protein [Gammaproteobacteria bacterium]
FQALTSLLKAGGEVTQAQIDQYEKYRQSMGTSQALEAAGITLTKEHEAAFLNSSHGIRVATESYDAAQKKLSSLNSASQQVGSALSSAFADAIVDGKKFGDVLSSLVKTLEKAAINSLFGSFFNAPASGGLSPVAGLLKGILPGFASGTDFAPGGAAVVGEDGPEIVNLPRGSQVVPNAIAARGGGSSVTVAPSYNIDATGADPAALSRLERTLVGLNASLERRAVAAVAQHQYRNG